MTFYNDLADWGDDGWDDDGHDGAAAWAGDGHEGIDECDASHIIKKSMEGQDYSEVDGVDGAEYRNSDADCQTIIAGANNVVVVQDKGLEAGAAFALLAMAAALVALAFLAYSKMRRRRRVPVQEQDMSLISTNLDGSLLYNDDPYANTIDVHKCASIYCNCNNELSDTTFLPAPKKVDMAKTLAAQGISPTAVNEADGEFFRDGEDSAEGGARQGSIMRVPIRSQLEGDRPLTPVNEIAHDSEIDTELEESVVGEDMGDDTTVPPPPPIAFHPGESYVRVHT